MSSVPCSLCGKVAWYFVKPKYYCGDHRQEAIDAAHKVAYELHPAAEPPRGKPPTLPAERAYTMTKSIRSAH